MSSKATDKDIKRFKPLYDTVVIEVFEKREMKTLSGIIIPSTSKESGLSAGKVIAVGNGKLNNGENIEVQVKPGDEVLFPEWAGTAIPINDLHNSKKYVVVKADDIKCIMLEGSHE